MCVILTGARAAWAACCGPRTVVPSDQACSPVWSACICLACSPVWSACICLAWRRGVGGNELARPVSLSVLWVLIMSTPYPSTSPFGPAGPTGTSYGMGAEGGLPTPLPPACSASQATMTPAQRATMDPALHAFHQMAAGPWVPQNNQHAIHCAQKLFCTMTTMVTTLLYHFPLPALRPERHA